MIRATRNPFPRRPPHLPAPSIQETKSDTPPLPSESAGTGFTSLKRKRRVFENTCLSMPFACASGLSQAKRFLETPRCTPPLQSCQDPGGWRRSRRRRPRRTDFGPGASPRSAPATQASFPIMGYNISRWSSARSLGFSLAGESPYYPGSKEGHIPTRSASEGSGAFPSLARRVNMQQHAELPCRGNTPSSPFS